MNAPDEGGDPHDTTVSREVDTFRDVNESAVRYAQRGYRLMWVVFLGFVVLDSLLLGEGVSRVIWGGNNGLLMIITGLALYLLFTLSIFTVESETILSTDRTPTQVRAELQSVDNPIAIYAYALADEDGVEVHETGATYETSLLLSSGTVRTRYEAEQQPDGTLLVRSIKNGKNSTSTTVSIEPIDDGGTSMTVTGVPVHRKSLLWLTQMLALGTVMPTLFKAIDYEMVDDTTRIGLRDRIICSI